MIRVFLICFTLMPIFSRGSMIGTLDLSPEQGVYPYSRHYRNFDTRQEMDSAYKSIGSLLVDERHNFLNELGYAFAIDFKGGRREAIEILSRLNNHPLVSLPLYQSEYYSVLGNIAINAENPFLAERYFKEAIRLCLADPNHIAQNLQGKYMSLATVLNALKRSEKAMQVLEYALSLDTSWSSRNALYLRLNIGLTHSLIGDLEKAKMHMLELLPEIRRRSDRFAEMRTLGNLATIYLDQDSLQLAERYCLEGSAKAREFGFALDRINFERNLSKISVRKGDFRQAYLHLLRNDSLRTAFNGPANQQMISQMESAFQIKEEKLRADFQEELRKAEQQNTFIAFILFVVSAFFALFFFLQSKQLREKNKLLLSQQLREVQPVELKTNSLSTESLALIRQLEDWIVLQKGYAEQDLTLDKIAKKLQTNRTYLSEAINGNFGKGFSQWINEIRVLEAKRMLVSTEFDHYSIEGIASLCGFASLSAFNANFKKITGLTPSYFRNNRSVIPD